MIKERSFETLGFLLLIKGRVIRDISDAHLMTWGWK